MDWSSLYELPFLTISSFIVLALITLDLIVLDSHPAKKGYTEVKEQCYYDCCHLFIQHALCT